MVLTTLRDLTVPPRGRTEPGGKKKRARTRRAPFWVVQMVLQADDKRAIYLIPARMKLCMNWR
jgi:hypothetical protein